MTDLSLKPGEQASLRYQFRPDPMLHPREFLVALHVFYNVRLPLLEYSPAAAHPYIRAGSCTPALTLHWQRLASRNYCLPFVRGPRARRRH